MYICLPAWLASRNSTPQVQACVIPFSHGTVQTMLNPDMRCKGVHLWQCRCLESEHLSCIEEQHANGDSCFCTSRCRTDYLQSKTAWARYSSCSFWPETSPLTCILKFGFTPLNPGLIPYLLASHPGFNPCCLIRFVYFWAFSCSMRGHCKVDSSCSFCSVVHVHVYICNL